MVGHEAIGVADPIVPFFGVLEGIKKIQTIGVVLEDRFLLIPA